jgi:hypothetical protein
MHDYDSHYEPGEPSLSSPMAHRVAACFRVGGLVKPPPVMHRDIRKWIVSVYAGHIWAKKEQVLQRLVGVKTEAEAALKDLEAFRRKVPGLVAKQKKFRFTAPLVQGAITADPKDEEWTLTITPFGRPRYQERGLYDPGLITNVVNGFLDRCKHRLWELTEDPGALAGRKHRPTKDLFVDTVQLIQLCKKLASKPKEYKTKASRKFPVDLSGWDYLTEEEKRGPRMENFTEITVTVFFKAHEMRGGQWHGYERTLEVDVMVGSVTDVTTFKASLANLDETLIHELGHLGQTATLIGRKGPDEGAMPSHKLRTPGYSPEGFPRPAGPGRGKQLEHALRDVEFYPNLGDATRTFIREVKKVPPADRQEAARMWVGDSQLRGKDYTEFTDRVPPAFRSSEHSFQLLKDKAPSKWVKAVKVFYSQVQSYL